MSLLEKIPRSTSACNIFRPAQFETAHPNLFDRPGRRQTWLRFREINGLSQTGAVFQKGRLLFINAERDVAWLTADELDEQGSELRK
jgi:hypothetical protein